MGWGEGFITTKPRIVETRTVWERTEEPPDGWRWLHNDLDTSGEFWALWTAAPEGYAVPMDDVHRYIWIRSLPHQERRYVTEWERV